MAKWIITIDRESAYIEVEAKTKEEAAKKGYEELMINPQVYDAWVAEVDLVEENDES